MTVPGLTTSEVETVAASLHERGYAVIEGLLSSADVRLYREIVAEHCAREREQPFDPGDGPTQPGDEELERYLRASYGCTDAEFARTMRRLRYTRAQNEHTTWPVPPEQISKLFLQLPTTWDQDRSQAVYRLVAKAPEVGRLVEHPTVLKLVQGVLGDDCLLSDCLATSIGAHSSDGHNQSMPWHVDIPLGQIPEPLPDFPITLQNAWMLDDFTEANGATQVVPGSHRYRKKPPWGSEVEDAVEILKAPAGSVGIWLSNTWHRAGPNFTDAPRRAVLCYYCRSWTTPMSDHAAGLTSAVAQSFSPHLRYLLGYSARPPVRG